MDTGNDQQPGPFEELNRNLARINQMKADRLIDTPQKAALDNHALQSVLGQAAPSSASLPATEAAAAPAAVVGLQTVPAPAESGQPAAPGSDERGEEQHSTALSKKARTAYNGYNKVTCLLWWPSLQNCVGLPCPPLTRSKLAWPW